MPVATVTTVQPQVLGGTIVHIEADITRGLHAFSIVGLAGQATMEAKDRVHSAIKQSGLPGPKSQNHKITISLAPADLKKEGPLFDLPIALAYLAATEAISVLPATTVFLGELALDGRLRPVRGVLSAALTAKGYGATEIVVPVENAKEAACVDGLNVYAAPSLEAVIRHLEPSNPLHTKLPITPPTVLTTKANDGCLLDDIKGQESAKRALIIAAAGRHNVILVGPPGTGKTMLARAFRELLPPLSKAETLEVAAIRSIAGETDVLTTEPPFRSPHHTASYTALVGGGVHPKPGEVTLAHRGVLFMDEFPEFDRRSLDALRQPLEDKVVSISRVQGTALFPADFILVAALNPYRGREDGTRDLARAMHETYHGKISGPILDRIDLWIEVAHISYETLAHTPRNVGATREAKKAVDEARARSLFRLAARGITTNNAMTVRDIEEVVRYAPDVETLLITSATKLNLSPRGYHRLIKVAQTIADLDHCDVITKTHVLEALSYRVPGGL